MEISEQTNRMELGATDWPLGVGLVIPVMRWPGLCVLVVKLSISIASVLLIERRSSWTFRLKGGGKF